MDNTSIDIIKREIKKVRWLGSSHEDLASSPHMARRIIGFELYNVQQGKVPSDFKPMRAVGPGVYEIRAHLQSEHRAFYVAKFDEAVYVLHVFEKKTRKTEKRDIDIGRRRFSEMIEL